jgi:hypothetical protein
MTAEETRALAAGGAPSVSHRRRKPISAMARLPGLLRCGWRVRRGQRPNTIVDPFAELPLEWSQRLARQSVVLAGDGRRSAWRSTGGPPWVASRRRANTGAIAAGMRRSVLDGDDPASWPCRTTHCSTPQLARVGAQSATSWSADAGRCAMATIRARRGAALSRGTESFMTDATTIRSISSLRVRVSRR